MQAYQERGASRILQGQQPENRSVSMELKDFVQKTITDIAEGILAAQDATLDEDGKPRYLVSPLQFHDANSQVPKQRNSEVVESINFDIAVTTSLNAEGAAGGKIFVAEAKLNGKYEDKECSRISFQVFVQWPHQHK